MIDREDHIAQSLQLGQKSGICGWSSFRGDRSPAASSTSWFGDVTTGGAGSTRNSASTKARRIETGFIVGLQSDYYVGFPQGTARSDFERAKQRRPHVEINAGELHRIVSRDENRHAMAC
jgi:hypothetical protein